MPAFLLALLSLRAMGMSANLLSMGAIDFGIIIDGAVVMVEGVFVALDKNVQIMCHRLYRQIHQILPVIE